MKSAVEIKTQEYVLMNRDRPIERDTEPNLFEREGKRVRLTASQRRNEARYRGSGREWATPPELFAELHAEFGFNLDPCATERSAKCDRFWTEQEDGLKQDWGTSTVFMNPHKRAGQ